MNEHTTPIRIFIAYSREDEALLEQLRKFLLPLERRNDITMWYDGKIMPGETWEQSIKDNLHAADIVMLLMSAESIASDYFWEREKADALERHRQGSCVVVPIILKPCGWTYTELKNLQALPKDGKPIVSAHWKNKEDALQSVLDGLFELVQHLQEGRKTKEATQKHLEEEKNRADHLQKEREEAERLRKTTQERHEREKHEQTQKAEQERLRREGEKVKNKKQFWQQLQTADELYEQGNYAQAQAAYQALLNWGNKSEMGYTDAQPHITQRVVVCKNEVQYADLQQEARSLQQQGNYTAALTAAQKALEIKPDNSELQTLQNELTRLIAASATKRRQMLQQGGMAAGALLFLLLAIFGAKQLFFNNDEGNKTAALADTTPTSGESTTSISPTSGESTTSISPTSGGSTASISPTSGGSTASISPTSGKSTTSISPISGGSTTSISPISGESTTSISPTSGGGKGGAAPFAPQMVSIQGGTFMMGSPDSEVNRQDDEYRHQVSVSSFKMSKYEVTQAQWKAIMGSNPSYFSGCDQCPVDNVSWDDIQEFLQKLNAQTGKTYRLPTEAEWEYAARGGTTTPFYTGNCLSTDQANYDGNYPYQTCAKGQGRAKTTPVGSYAPNKYGLYDMHGNVWEWCQDWYDADYYKNSPANNPKGPGNSSVRVLRGGSWIYDAQDCRSANRSDGNQDYRNIINGFRLVFAP